jgi:acyl-CoA reductase-like NAD-dependent aldehyde dehydrogenase
LAANGDHLKKVALELGGNAPFVVLDDADVDQAIRAAVIIPCRYVGSRTWSSLVGELACRRQVSFHHEPRER